MLQPAPTCSHSHLQPLPCLQPLPLVATPACSHSHLQPLPLVSMLSRLQPLPLVATPSCSHSQLQPLPVVATPSYSCTQLQPRPVVLNPFVCAPVPAVHYMYILQCTKIVHLPLKLKMALRGLSQKSKIPRHYPLNLNRKENQIKTYKFRQLMRYSGSGIQDFFSVGLIQRAK